MSGLSSPESTVRATRPPSLRNRSLEANQDDLRRRLPRVFGFMLVAWLSFATLDLYIVLVLDRSASLSWFLL